MSANGAFIKDNEQGYQNTITGYNVNDEVSIYFEWNSNPQVVFYLWMDGTKLDSPNYDTSSSSSGNTQITYIFESSGTHTVQFASSSGYYNSNTLTYEIGSGGGSGGIN